MVYVTDSSIIPGIPRPGRNKPGEKGPKHEKLVLQGDLKHAIDNKWVAAKHIPSEPSTENLEEKASSYPSGSLKPAKKVRPAKRRPHWDPDCSVIEWFVNDLGQPITRYHTLENGLIFWPKKPYNHPVYS